MVCIVFYVCSLTQQQRLELWTLWVQEPCHTNSHQLFTLYYRGGVICWVRGSVRLISKFALPPFSPPLPSGVQISKQNMH